MLLDQFRDFYFKNYPDDMEQLIEYFAVFGGLDIELDSSMHITELIRIHIFNNFDEISTKIERLTHSDPVNIRLLNALAVGDRRIFSAFKRAGLNNGNGGAALKYLQERGVVEVEYSRETHQKELQETKLKRELARHRISDKVLFTYPYLRFWFYFIIPYIREIKEGNYINFFESFNEKQNQYTSLIFEELSELLLNYNLRDSQILSSGSYWDMNLEIDILTLTDNGSVYVAECKWTNHKVNKKELNKLEDKCEKLGIAPTQILLFSKRGFSKELESMAGKEIALYKAKDFKALLKSR
ncbi:MAG: DUF234 domain-containing protein [Thiovulaceae bacterium]|nr:DUF234 domain-containing protein [Sulfurimonadaceae bacterium]MCW9027138.1 DUF234 domain-containing protein [Sulfurimonadaceae bacterium]